MAKIKRGVLMFLQLLAVCAMSTAVALRMLFESSTRCDIIPKVESELAARYERDSYGYLVAAYPGKSWQQRRALASNVIARLTGRTEQWGNQQNDR